MGGGGLPDFSVRSKAQGCGTELEWASPWEAALCCLRPRCPVCCPVLAPTLPGKLCCINDATFAQKGKEKKKAKYDSLQDLRKNKKELEFEQKLYKEKEEMLEKEKQLKINRLAQEVRALL